jgi:tetratricopeptide (TPR) repeat protein
MPRLQPTRAALLATLLVCIVPTRLHPQGETPQQLRTRAFDLAYNLDHDEAMTLLRRAAAAAPEDPASHRSLAAVLWLNILFRRGAVTVDHYLGSFSRASVDLPKPPPDVDREFRQLVARARELAERQVKAAPRDPVGHYNLGAVLGIEASYVATVEGRMLAGFKTARRAYDEHEKVLELNPALKDAGLVVGTYRYIVSTLSLPLRMMAYVAGFGGGRERGLHILEETAAAAGENRTDAMFGLVLMYNRERRYADALRVLQELRRLYPRNRLVVLEAGSTALRGGMARQADDLLTQGMDMLARDKRTRVPGEAALWHYKRGAARAALGRSEQALSDLTTALSGDGQPWVQGRARTEVGRLALQRGDRETAVSEARQAETLCTKGNDPVCVEAARRLLRSSHGG